MKLYTLPALTDFSYRGDRVLKGQKVTLSLAGALVFSRRGWVPNPRTYTPEPDPPEPPRSRRTYRRRDLTAEAA
jgi:hypothetical protein